MTPPPSTARRFPTGEPERCVTQVVGACPHDCPDTCSLLTTVENGIAIRVQGNPDHPQTGGVLCNKVSRYTERTYHAERLLQPLKRTGAKGLGRFEPVSCANAHWPGAWIARLACAAYRPGRSVRWRATTASAWSTGSRQRSG